MLDLRLRHVKERVAAPLVRAAPPWLSAGALSTIGFALTVGAAIAAWRSLIVVSVVCWLAGRVVDGLDGAVARARGTASDLGGYTDLLLDTVGYAVVPLGIAVGVDDRGTWIAAAVVIASFYVNSVSWLLLSALLERRALGAVATGEQTSVTMPTGLVEGAETIVFFTIALALPSIAAWCFAVMAVGVAIGVVQRAVAARRLLGRH